MKCPYCDKKIDNKLISHYLAAKGGRAGVRTLTREQAQAMGFKSAEARRRNELNKADKVVDLEIPNGRSK